MDLHIPASDGKMLALLYRTLVAWLLRKPDYETLQAQLQQTYRLKREKKKWRYCKYYFQLFRPRNEKQQAYKEWSNSIRSPYPYLWIKEYFPNPYRAEWDEQHKLHYVNHHGKKLYFKHDSVNAPETVYQALRIEQDERSAHRYVASYDELKGKTLLDIGAAEGIFALDVIEQISHAYLFECDEEWIAALTATFAPWKEKVTIVRKYVSDTDSESTTTLDTFLKDKSTDNLFLKMDIEGYESQALYGTEQTLKHSPTLSGSICIYHRREDEHKIPAQLQQYGKQTHLQPGYLYFEGEMRRAIVRFK